MFDVVVLGFPAEVYLAKLFFICVLFYLYPYPFPLLFVPSPPEHHGDDPDHGHQEHPSDGDLPEEFPVVVGLA